MLARLTGLMRLHGQIYPGSLGAPLESSEIPPKRASPVYTKSKIVFNKKL